VRFSTLFRTGLGGPPTFLYIGCRVIPGGKSTGSWCLTAHLYLVLKLKKE